MLRKVFVLLIVIATGLVAIGAESCDDDDDGGGGSTTSTTASELCQFAAAGLEILAQRVHEGESAAAIIKFFGPTACDQAIKAVVDDPSESLSLEVELPDGEITPFSGSAEELIILTSPATEEEEEEEEANDLSRVVPCLATYSIQFLYEDCVDDLDRTLTTLTRAASTQKPSANLASSVIISAAYSTFCPAIHHILPLVGTALGTPTVDKSGKSGWGLSPKKICRHRQANSNGNAYGANQSKSNRTPLL